MAAHYTEDNRFLICYSTVPGKRYLGESYAERDYGVSQKGRILVVIKVGIRRLSQGKCLVVRVLGNVVRTTLGFECWSWWIGVFGLCFGFGFIFLRLGFGLGCFIISI